MRINVVGSLVGDGWNKVRKLVALCKKGKVEVFAGSYALPVWEWANEHVIGADFEIIHVVDDPDEVENPYCPGKGFIALNKALEDLKAEFCDESILDLDKAFLALPQEEKAVKLEFKNLDLRDGSTTVIHAYTKHNWKNLVFQDTEPILCSDQLKFSKPIQSVGLPGEPTPPGCEVLNEKPFEQQAAAIASAHGFIGVLSAWTEYAGMLGKRQIIVSFTKDVPQPNPRAIKLICPELRELQEIINREEL